MRRSKESLTQAVHDFIRTRTGRKQNTPAKLITNAFCLKPEAASSILKLLVAEGKIAATKDGWYSK